jgi:hypothetical protein
MREDSIQSPRNLGDHRENSDTHFIDSAFLNFQINLMQN